MSIKRDIFVEEEKKQEAEKILIKTKYLIFFRLIFATFLLGVTLFFQARQYHSFLSFPLVYLCLLAGSLFFFTAVFTLYLRYVRNPVVFAYGQLIFDVFFVSLIIAFTGGISSIFSFGYMIIIIIAASILSRRGSIIIASTSCILYGFILDLQYYGLLQYLLPHGLNYSLPSSTASYLYTLLVSSSAFYLVAFLSSHLTEELKKSKVQLKAKQKDLVELEMLNKNIVQSINSGLITLDNDFRIIYFNRAAREIIGSENESDLLNASITDIFPSISLFLPGDSFHGQIEYQKSNRGEMEFVRKSGETVFLGFSLSILKGQGGRGFGHILVFQDLTLLKKMEQQVKHMERLALAGEMASIVAHEIKNPLASVSGSIQMLKSELDLNPLQDRLMGIVCRETERLNSLINEFSLFIKSRKGAPEKVEVDLVIDNTLTMLKNSWSGNKKIQIKRIKRDDVQVYVDPQQFQQLLWNLFTNAVDSMMDGGVLSVKTSLMNTRGKETDHFDQVEILISDTGHGIPDTIQNRIFDPFFTTKTKGTGLGLSIVKRIVSENQGKILVDKNHPKGTIFRVYFPSETNQAK